jgi:hypothetical protein
VLTHPNPQQPDGAIDMHAFIRFNRGILAMPIHWRLWLALLVGTNLVVPLFFIERAEAQAAIGAFVTSMGLMTALTARFGFSRILGFGHVAWVPLLGFLLTRLSEVPMDDAFGLWLRVVIALDATSLVIDAIDVVRFVRGERGEIVQQLATAAPDRASHVTNTLHQKCKEAMS